MVDLVLVSFAEGIGGLAIRCLSSYAKMNGIATRLIYIAKESRASFTDENKGKIKQSQIRALLEYLIEYKVKYLGISLMTNDFRAFQNIVPYLRNNNWNGLIIAGGIHPSIRPEETLLNGVDYVVMGPGELPLVQIINNVDQAKISGLVFRDGDKIIRHSVSDDAVIDLDNLPFPNYDLNDYYLITGNGKIENITIDLYQKLVPARGKYYYLMTSRGCPYRCSYCCNDNRYRVRRASVDYVLKELHYITEQLPFTEGINIQDDSFFMGSDKWLNEFCAKYKIEFNWPIILRITPKFATHERLKMLKDSGLEYVSIGLQGSDRMNSGYYNRKETKDTFLKACLTMSELNIIYMVDVIVDVVYETDDDLREVASTLNKLPRPYRVLAFSMTPFPGTPFYDRVVKDGLIEKFGADAYDSTFQATRMNAYQTPRYWFKLIRYILPVYEGPVVDQLVNAGPNDKRADAMVEKLYKRAMFKQNMAFYLRSKAPVLFDKALHIYYRIKNQWMK